MVARPAPLVSKPSTTPRDDGREWGMGGRKGQKWQIEIRSSGSRRAVIRGDQPAVRQREGSGRRPWWPPVPSAANANLESPISTPNSKHVSAGRYCGPGTWQGRSYCYDPFKRM